MVDEKVQHRILARVRKMIKLAQDAGATEGERDNAMRMVHATLAKYNLSLSQVDTAEGADEARGRLKSAFLGKPWALQIAAAIARMCFCGYYYQTLRGNAGPKQKAMHVFIGRHSNVVTAQEMAAFVVDAVDKEANAYRRSIGGRYQDYRAFAQGAAGRIRQRCYEIEQKSKENGIEDPDLLTHTPGTALVLADLYKTEADANKKALEVLGVKLGSGRSQSYAEGEHARRAGAAFGSRVSLHRQVKKE